MTLKILLSFYLYIPPLTMNEMIQFPKILMAIFSVGKPWKSIIHKKIVTKVRIKASGVFLLGAP